MFLFTLNILSTAYLSWSIRWPFQESLIQSTYGRLLLSYVRSLVRSFRTLDLFVRSFSTIQVFVRLGTILTLNSAWSLRIVACFLYDLLLCTIVFRWLYDHCTASIWFLIDHCTIFERCRTISKSLYKAIDNFVRSRNTEMIRNDKSNDLERSS